MLEMQKRYDTEQTRLDMLTEIAIEQVKHQAQNLTYHHIYWK